MNFYFKCLKSSYIYIFFILRRFFIFVIDSISASFYPSVYFKKQTIDQSMSKLSPTVFFRNSYYSAAFFSLKCASALKKMLYLLPDWDWTLFKIITKYYTNSRLFVIWFNWIGLFFILLHIIYIYTKFQSNFF